MNCALGRAWNRLGFWVFLLLQGCGYAVVPYDTSVRVGTRVDLGEIRDRRLAEISGVVASRNNPDVVWVHNDSGDANTLYALATSGELRASFTITGCVARDWEDIAIGPGPQAGQAYLYIADIGDNVGQWHEKRICRVVEPHLSAGPATVVTLKDVDVITFRYPRGFYDAETLLVDPLTADLYVITKTADDGARVFRAPFPQRLHETLELQEVARLDINGVCAGDVSSDGRDIILKNLGAVFHWRRREGESLWQALQRAPTRLSYIREPQGEALGWAVDGRGYYTISERVAFFVPHLYYFPLDVDVAGAAAGGGE